MLVNTVNLEQIMSIGIYHIVYSVLLNSKLEHIFKRCCMLNLIQNLNDWNISLHVFINDFWACNICLIVGPVYNSGILMVIQLNVERVGNCKIWTLHVNYYPWA